MAKQPAWNERDTATVAQEGIERQARNNWRKVTITAHPTTGDIVVEYTMPNGAPDVKHYSQQQFVELGRNLLRTIGFHVTP
jgi:hypothetical protein